MKTRPLYIDFAPGARRFPRAGVLLLLAGVALLAFGLFQSAQLVARQSQARATLREVEAAHAVVAAPARPDVRQVALSRATRQVAGTLTTPWSRLLTSLGSASVKDVALLSVEPSVAKRSVRLTAEARDTGEMLAYVAALQRDPRLSSVVLVTHQVQAQTPGTPVRFQVQAQWGDAS